MEPRPDLYTTLTLVKHGQSIVKCHAGVPLCRFVMLWYQDAGSNPCNWTRTLVELSEVFYARCGMETMGQVLALLS